MKLKKATEEAVKAQREIDRLRVREAALKARLDIASQFLMPDQPKTSTPPPKQLSRKERRDLQFGRVSPESARS